MGGGAIHINSVFYSKHIGINIIINMYYIYTKVVIYFFKTIQKIIFKDNNNIIAGILNK